MLGTTAAAPGNIEIAWFFEISFIHRASSLRRPAALPRASFPAVFPHLPVYISSPIASLRGAATSRIRKNDVPDDAAPVLGTDSYCQLLLAYAPIPAGSRESYEAPFGRSRGDSRISSSPSTNSVSIFASHLEVSAPKLM